MFIMNGMAEHVAQHSRAQANRGRRRFWGAVLIVSSLVFVAALVVLVAILLSYWQEKNLYDSVADIAFDTPLSDTIDSDEAALASVSIDWDALLAINPDTVGWIYIPGTAVNHPIVQGTDNEYYLYRDFEGNTSWVSSPGCVFLNAENTSDFSDTNNILFGHRRNGGGMFGALADFQDSDVFNENRTVYLFTPTANYCFTTFAALVVSPSDPLAQANFASDEELLSYVEDKLSRSVVSADPAYTASEVVESGQLLTLVTCGTSSSTQRVVVFAFLSEVALLDDTLLDDTLLDDASASTSDTSVTSDSTDSSGATISSSDAAAVESAAEEAA